MCFLLGNYPPSGVYMPTFRNTLSVQDSVPKRRHINSRRRVITQKKAYNMQNMGKAWNYKSQSCLYEHFWSQTPNKSPHHLCPQPLKYFRAVRKIATKKAPVTCSFVMSVCPSARLLLKGFTESWQLTIFPKISRQNPTFIKFRPEYRVFYGNTYWGWRSG